MRKILISSLAILVAFIMILFPDLRSDIFAVVFLAIAIFAVDRLIRFVKKHASKREYDLEKKEI